MTKKTKVDNTKAAVITKYQLHEKDTGSPAVQIAILTERITNLADHLKGHKQDNSSRRGLLSLVGQRRKWFNYMQKSEPETATKLKKDLGL